jgi:hypothetical protein
MLHVVVAVFHMAEVVATPMEEMQGVDAEKI